MIFKRAIIIIVGVLALQGFTTNDDTMIKENGVYIINTTTIGKDIEGYNGPTPLKVYIKNNKVEKIEFLKNVESPKYYAKVKNAKTLQVDAVTGATYSSTAVIQNVQLAIDYYQSHK